MVQIKGLVFQWIRLPKQPLIKGSVKGSAIKRRVFFRKAKVFIADNSYKLISDYDMRKIINLNRFSEMTYEKEVRDCDDYSFGLMGLIRKLLPGVAFGIMWVDVFNEEGKVQYKHALNFFIDNKNTLWAVEPQQNWVFRPSKKMVPFFVVI